MSYLPTDDKARKNLPLFQQLVRYFPKTLREVTKVSVVNNVRYNPEREPADINWNRGKSPDQFGSAFRHMLERTVDGKIYDYVDPEVAKRTGIERIYVLAQAVWRLSAACEEEIEAMEREQRAPQGTCGEPKKEIPRCACGSWEVPNEFDHVMVAEQGTLVHHTRKECQFANRTVFARPEVVAEKWPRRCACGSVMVGDRRDSYAHGGKVHAYHDCMPEGNV